MPMYNPEQPRDWHGRWTQTKQHAPFLAEHGDEIAIGLGVAAAIAIGYGAFVAEGVGVATADLAPEAATIIKNSATVRKVGPISLKGIEKIAPVLKDVGPKSAEAWQYSKGFLSPNLAEDTLEAIPGGIRGLRVGGEVATKTGTKTIGAAKPLYYDQMTFAHNKHLLTAGGILGGGATLAGGAHKLHKRKN